MWTVPRRALVPRIMRWHSMQEAAKHSYKCRSCRNISWICWDVRSSSQQIIQMNTNEKETSFPASCFQAHQSGSFSWHAYRAHLRYGLNSRKVVSMASIWASSGRPGAFKTNAVWCPLVFFCNGRVVRLVRSIVYAMNHWTLYGCCMTIRVTVQHAIRNWRQCDTRRSRLS